MVTPDGKFVYAANRLHDSIAWFSIAETGMLTLRGEEWTRGDYPRSFGIDPSGGFLFSCNQRSDAIAAFRRDKKSGGLTFTGQLHAGRDAGHDRVSWVVDRPIHDHRTQSPAPPPLSRRERGAFGSPAVTCS